ncbi:MAG: Cytochrome-c peroxidase [Bacteroidetes bacterium]|jgi:cytochrome c peroxidase|nr:Cytochrome-c peroxidase [Bacteroidota bacterium]
MKLKVSIFSVFIVALLIAVSCRKKPLIPDEDAFSSEPVLPEKPYDYPKSHNDHLATLGRVLFYDRSLSLNNSISCAGCHQQSKAFCDNLQFSTGLMDQQTGRNSPSIFARSGKLFWDGRANNMKDLVLRPIKNHVEMKFENIDHLIDKISTIDYYKDLFYKAYGAGPIDSVRIQTAMAEFLTNFEFSHNKFNRNRNTGFKEFTASEMHGKDLFFGKARCSQCHKINDDGTGTGYGSTIQSLSFNIGLEQVYEDRGVGSISNDAYDYGKFMVPVLLNVEYTAPYMHDGRFKTLDEVVEHYNSGLKNHPNLDVKLRDLGSLNSASESEVLQALDQNKNGKVDPPEMSAYPPAQLGLSAGDKKALVDFLKTLSDPTIFSETKFGDPFKKN